MLALLQKVNYRREAHSEAQAESHDVVSHPACALSFKLCSYEIAALADGIHT